MLATSNITAPTQFVETEFEKYAYRRFGNGSGLPLVCFQHFTGTLDNWDPAVTDPLAHIATFLSITTAPAHPRSKHAQAAPVVTPHDQL
jgi:hypothetical protein